MDDWLMKMGLLQCNRDYLILNPMETIQRETLLSSSTGHQRFQFILKKTNVTLFPFRFGTFLRMISMREIEMQSLRKAIDCQLKSDRFGWVSWDLIPFCLGYAVENDIWPKFLILFLSIYFIYQLTRMVINEKSTSKVIIIIYSKNCVTSLWRLR